MTPTYLILTTIFIVICIALILIILVQRPAGGGLAGAFGGAGGGGTESVFGGRVGDALTVMTVVCFCVYLGLGIALNLLDSRTTAAPPPTVAETLLPGSDPFETPESTDGGDLTTPAATPATTPEPAAEEDGVFSPIPDVPSAEPASTSDGEGS